MHTVCPMIGFQNERRRLGMALREKESLLITGPAGSGKSTLIDAAIGDLSRAGEIVKIRYSSNLHGLLTDLTRSLLAFKHRTLLERARPGADIDKWLMEQTSVHLKGLLWTALEIEPRTLVLDGIDRASFPMYRFLQRLYFLKGMMIVAAARDVSSLGALGRLFWDPRSSLHMRALNKAESEHLFDEAVGHFSLGHLDIEEFREKALDSAKGNPGQIVAMCKLATDPLYLSGTHIKFAPLRIDVFTQFLG